MKLDYTEGGTVKFSMIDYINEIIDEFDNADPKGRGINTSSPPEYIYKVDEEFKNISPDKAKMFHNLVSETLYTTKQASPYTCTDLALLTTTVKETNKYD